ncbi:aminodeoxychorismate/anthranilate synthase component II [Budviciaceae bacterium BWR-B9]|uniref:Aminodeoxychorismate/anthranilate synthase component II n=1 Tax=Limnobaculum allomyrinae TaxID=2791986 RepID=A0ABS1IU66_9GAMM|nr:MULTISPECIES: aminodeoxychorismate/anthranilate synthase component II [Limnobaculum]MBK5145304.1 aminodeoxychorismate/anthranilate synthase component II [Limnobaculum allomyrinae]MBV7693268.1 aminodeoxychorismate/anthranilate synthase component II [Limnobaculum sp. M2-1]
MILLIDNYDSFSYNLYDYLCQSYSDVRIVKNDQLQLNEIAALAPAAIILSPGPGTPENAGITLEVIRSFAGAIPLLGVCLGHQAIAQAFGARIVKCPVPTHGKTELITHDGRTLFAHLPSPLQVTRYHSLMVEPSSLPEALEISAITHDGIIMGLRHKQWPIEGVQFHPEAILTESGLTLLQQFVTTYTSEGA